MNLEPQEVRAAREKRRVAGRTRFGALLATATLMVLVLVWDIRDSEETVARRGEGTWARTIGKLRSIRKARLGEADGSTQARTALDRAFDVAQPLGDIAVHLGDSLPADVWLTGMAIERGKPVQIRGTAKTNDAVAAAVDALSRSDRLRDVRLLFANATRIDQSPVVQFSITATAVGNLPMPEPDRSAKRSKGSSSAKGVKE